MAVANFANFKRMIKARIPILKWLPRYKLTDALGDLIAGLTVGMTLIPQVRDIRSFDRLALFDIKNHNKSRLQAIAYAGLAGLEPQYGLYSAFAGSFVYIFFGTCREVNIGPTALISLLTWTYARYVRASRKNN